MSENTTASGYDIASLMKEYGNDVLRTAYAYVKDKDAAEDLFQEVFIKAYYNLDKFRGESSIKTWLIRITINVAKDHLKSAYQRRVVPMTEGMEETLEAEDAYEAVDNADRDAQVKRAVMTLPESYREVVMCIYYREMSVAETAALLGVAEGTIKSRLFRAREQLKTMLEGRL